ncbi:hypothetical protein ABEW05_007734 [Botrytis cinerea]
MWPWPFPDILGARGRCKGQEHEVFDTHVVPLPQLAKESPDVGGNAMDETTGKWDPNSPPRIAKRLGMALMEAVGDLWLVAVRGKIWALALAVAWALTLTLTLASANQDANQDAC